MASARLKRPNKKAPPLLCALRHSAIMLSRRATSFKIASFIATDLGGLRKFIGQALRNALKPECISAEIERAIARAALFFGHICLFGQVSFRYSMIASESQITKSLCLRIGTKPALEYRLTALPNCGSPKRINFSANGISKAASAI